MKKTAILLLAIATIISFTQCSNRSNNKLCSNEDTRGKIISELMNNDAYMMQVMDSMQTRHADAIVSRSRAMMKSDKAMGIEIMNNMMSMCSADSSMCKIMMGKAMEMCDIDKSKCKIMIGSMKEHPKVMQSMKDMGMCGMKGMNMEQKKGDNSHLH